MTPTTMDKVASNTRYWMTLYELIETRRRQFDIEFSIMARTAPEEVQHSRAVVDAIYDKINTMVNDLHQVLGEILGTKVNPRIMLRKTVFTSLRKLKNRVGEKDWDKLDRSFIAETKRFRDTMPGLGLELQRHLNKLLNVDEAIHGG